MKLIIFFLLICSFASAQTRYKKQVTDPVTKKVTQTDVTISYIQNIKTIDSLNLTLAEFKSSNRIDTSWLSKIKVADYWYILDKLHTQKYYGLDSCNDYSKCKMRITVEYKVGTKRRTFRFSDDE